jgi:taurine transport system permease protein
MPDDTVARSAPAGSDAGSGQAARGRASLNLFRLRPARPGEIYGVPGQGDSLAISVASSLTILGLWSLVSWMEWVKPLFIPAPWTVLETIVDTATEGFANATLLEHTVISFLRVFGAFLFACLIGIPLGLAMGVNRIARGVFDPPIEFYRPVPPLAYLPLMIIWFGIGEVSKVGLIFLSCLAPIALGTRSGVRSAAIEQIHAAYSLGASRWQVITQVVLPSALPEILTAMRIGIGFGWTTLVAAEMVAATHGLGYMVLTAANFLRTPVVIMGIVIIAAIAYAFDLLMRWIERRVVPWKGRA